MESLTHNFLHSETFLENLFLLSSHRNYLVAYSGGMDSHVLLHLLATCKNLQFAKINVRAVHVHHGLQEIADSWPKHCQSVCDDFGLPFETLYLDLKVSPSESLEAVARQGRYQALQNILQKDEVLLTAHHQRDQAETFLLQLFRGAGVQGLASMPNITSFGVGQHARPLLEVPYSSLQKYALDNQLNYIQDPSNLNNNFNRNFLRNDVIPELIKHWQGFDKAVSRSAKIQAETKQLLDEMAADLLVSFPDQKHLSIPHLLQLSKVKQKLILRYWLTQSGFTVPSEVKLNHIISDVLKAKVDAQPLLVWQGVEIRRYSGNVYCNAPLKPHDNKQVIRWEGEQALRIESLGISIPRHVLLDLGLQHQTVTVRFRQGGERLYSTNKKHSQSLKKRLNDALIPPWLRDRVPLIYVEDRLVHIVETKF